MYSCTAYMYMYCMYHLLFLFINQLPVMCDDVCICAEHRSTAYPGMNTA